MKLTANSDDTVTSEHFDTNLFSWQRQRSNQELKRFISRRSAIVFGASGCDDLF